VTVQLRPYQREAIEAVLSARRAGHRRLLVQLPTGAGKTVVFSELAARARRQVMVLAHREELLEQARDKLGRALGGKRQVGLERGAERAEPEAEVLVCSMRSLGVERLAALLRGRDIGLIVYDECHHATATDNLRVLEQLGVFRPDYDGTLLGFTATTERADGQGLDRVFEKIAYSRSLPQLIEDGFLVPLSGYRLGTPARLDQVKVAGRDLDEESLAQAVDIEERNVFVARAIQELARDRRTIAFAVNVAHAQHLAHALRLIGVSAATVHGEMASAERARVLADFRAGRYQVLSNVAVLTEGFDDPEVSCIAMARPTRSASLYTQCVGRGTRLFEGKRDCLVLDFADVSELDLCTLPSLFGAPRDMDLTGGRADEAGRVFRNLQFDHPGFELEARGLTLSEIQRSALAFDPLRQEVDPELRAISENAWFSLGRHGVGLHFEARPGQRSEVLVLCVRSRGKRWQVSIDGHEQARFSRMEEAVEAVDYELGQRGPSVRASARPDAALAPGVAEAARLEAWERIHAQRGKRTS
jgi:superfamily II DNA or RNA helicase